MRVVIKVGTSLIAPGGQIDANLLRAMVDQFDLSRNEYLIVTSGAIAAGMSDLGLREAPDRRTRHAGVRRRGPKQADAHLRAAFLRQKSGRATAAFQRRFHFAGPLSAICRTRWRELLTLGVVPIVNENDSVSVRELVGAFGDNDELSSLLATAVKADWLLLLTDVDGFYMPNGSKKPRLVRVVRKLTPALEALCNGKSKLGTRRHDFKVARRESWPAKRACTWPS